MPQSKYFDFDGDDDGFKRSNRNFEEFNIMKNIYSWIST